MQIGAVVVRVLTALIVGAGIGAVIGGLLTGDPGYTIAWSLAIPLSIGAVLFARTFRGTRAPRPSTRNTLPSMRAAGIRNPGDPVAAQARQSPSAVLNPPSTALPVGTTLNGESVAEPVSARASRRPGAARRAATVVAVGLLVVAGAAAALIPAYRTIGWHATNIANGRWDGNDMRTGLHQQEAVDDLAAVVGSYEFSNVAFYDSYIIVVAPTSPGATTSDTYMWRYGRAWRDGPNSGSVDGLFDASQIDFSLIGPMVRTAELDTGWDSFSSYPGVTLGADGEPEVTVSVTNDYYSATYRFSTQGRLIERSGTGLDEP